MTYRREPESEGDRVVIERFDGKYQALDDAFDRIQGHRDGGFYIYERVEIPYGDHLPDYPGPLVVAGRHLNFPTGVVRRIHLNGPVARRALRPNEVST